MNKQYEFLNKLSNIKIGKKNYRTDKKFLIFFRDYAEMLSDANCKSKK